MEMSRRTLNRILRKLVDDGMIERVRRHRRGRLGQMIFCSTLYKFKGKLFNWLYLVTKRLKSFFSFHRVPFWAQYKPKKELNVLPSTSTPMDFNKRRTKSDGPSDIKSILTRLAPVL